MIVFYSITLLSSVVIGCDIHLLIYVWAIGIEKNNHNILNRLEVANNLLAARNVCRDVYWLEDSVMVAVLKEIALNQMNQIHWLTLQWFC